MNALLPPRRLLATVVLSLAAPACSGPQGLTPTPAATASPTPTPDLPAALGCDGASGLRDDLPTITAPAVLATVATSAFHAAAVGDREALWVGCGPRGEVLTLDGGAWVGIQPPSDGTWRLTALVDGAAVAQGTFEVTNLPGDVVRFDLDQVGTSYTPHDLGALPWPSELYRDALSKRILLSESSIRAAVPDALYTLVDYMAPGIQRGWASLSGFPVTSALWARTEGIASLDVLAGWEDSTAFEAEGAPAILVELVDGAVRPDSPRLPLEWRYVRTYDAEVVSSAAQGSVETNATFERNGLSMWLPPGQVLKEDTTYLWLLTTGIGGARGPWLPSEGFTGLLRYGWGSGDEAAALRQAVLDAVDVLPDVPDVGVVAGAALFHTQSFTDTLDAVHDCAADGACDGVDLSRIGARWPAPSPALEDAHVYWDEVPAAGEDRDQRTLKELFYNPMIDPCTRIFPYDDYRVVAFGTFTSPGFLGTEIDPFDPEHPLGKVMVDDAQGRPVAFGSQRLRFSLIVPKAPPADGDRYPVVVFVHGLGNDQSDLLKAAEYLAPQGFAVLAIDQLYHGSRYDGPVALAEELGIPTSGTQGAEPHTDQVNNVLFLEAPQVSSPSTLEAVAADTPWGTPGGTGTGDGLDDAITTPPYGVLSILGFFRGLQNFRGMGDNLRQLSVDLMQVERMLAQADQPSGLNTLLRSLDPGLPRLSTGAPLYHGRSLGSIGLGVHLGAERGARTAVLGVPGAGVGTALAATSPFVGAILVIADDVLSCLPNKCTSWVDVDSGEVNVPVPAAKEYLRPGDPFTHLVEGLLEPGDPLAVVGRLARDARSGPANLLLQHVCDDEVVPNPATEVWAEAAHIPALAPVDVGSGVASVPGTLTEAWLPSYDATTDYPEGCVEPDPTVAPPSTRTGVRANQGVDTTQVLLSYCPGTHGGLYDRRQGDARQAYYPDGPFPWGSEAVFPTLPAPLPVWSPYHAAREAASEFLLAAARGEVPIAVAPSPVQIDDSDADGIPWVYDPCPLGANPIYWTEGGAACADAP